MSPNRSMDKQSTEYIYIYMEDHLAIKEWPADSHTRWINLRCIIISGKKPTMDIHSDSVYMGCFERQTYRNRNQQTSGCLGWGRVDSKAAVWGTLLEMMELFHVCPWGFDATRLMHLSEFIELFTKKRRFIYTKFYKWKILNNYFF